VKHFSNMAFGAKVLSRMGILPGILLLVLLSQGRGLCGEPSEKTRETSPASFSNPIFWEDMADPDIIRVGDTFYYSSSTMHYSPGAPILRSYDLVNWEYVGHSVPVLDFSPAYDLQGGNAYVKGVWASFLGYRKSNQTYYWGGCIEFSKSYIYTAKSPEGPWEKRSTIDNCWYDAGLLIDEDTDTMYVAYGNGPMKVAQLSADGLHQVKTQVVFDVPQGFGSLEGSRFYKVNGNYYIVSDRIANGEFVLKSTHGPFGPYEMRKLVLDAVSPVPDAGAPHQGGLVQTSKGDWYYLAFTDAYPGGRVPVLAPVKWSADGWPELQITDNKWSQTFPFPRLAEHKMKPLAGTDSFSGPLLGPEWEWNHNPDNSKWALHGGLQLETATQTDDLYAARNTLTHRILGPVSTATIVLDNSEMKDGDRAGLAMFRDLSAWVGVKRDAGVYKVVMEDNLAMDRRWNTISKGREEAEEPVAKGKIWLRVTADIHSGPNRTASFSYSTDGVHFHSIGTAFTLNNSWTFFMGYRYGIFNYATEALGGKVSISSFTMTTP